jgi:hypothetical protein
MQDQSTDATVADNANIRQTVQVRLVGAPRAYDYEWAGDTPLEIGEWVDLPGNVVSPEGCIGRVEGTAAPKWEGELKPVLSRQPDPWGATFSRVTTPKEASEAWNRARKAGLSVQRLAELTELAKVVLAKRAQAVRARAGENLERRMREEDPQAWVEMKQAQRDAVPGVDPAVEERAWADRRMGS